MSTNSEARKREQEHYEAYCEFITTEDPTFIPSSIEDWRAFNKAMDQSGPKVVGEHDERDLH